MDDERGIHTRQEILSQSAVWKAALSDVLSKETQLREFFQRKAFTEVIFTGCGSTYYLSLTAAAIFQALTGVRARALPASELFLFPGLFLTKGAPILLVAVSRSGETTETLQAVQSFKKSYGEDVLAISCHEGSPLVGECSISLVAKEAKEASVVQTRSFSSMLLIAQLCAGIAAGRPDYCEQLKALPIHGERVIKEQRRLIRELGGNEEIGKFVFLGSGPNYGLACEAMLKMKEMSLSLSEAFHFLEFRHGPKSAINGKTLVVGLLSDSARDWEIPVLEEARAIGAKTLVLTEGGEKGADYLVQLNSGLSELARGVLYMPLLQLLAYHRALLRGLDPDVPSHLDAVVKLEMEGVSR